MAEYDIGIMGAGVVGLTFALAAAKLPVKIAIIDQKKTNNDWSIERFPERVSAITLGSEFAFKRLSVWQSIAQARLQPFDTTVVWDSIAGGEMEFNAQSLGLDHLGHTFMVTSTGGH